MDRTAEEAERQLEYEKRFREIIHHQVIEAIASKESFTYIHHLAGLKVSGLVKVLTEVCEKYPGRLEHGNEIAGYYLFDPEHPITAHDIRLRLK